MSTSIQKRKYTEIHAHIHSNPAQILINFRRHLQNLPNSNAANTLKNTLKTAVDKNFNIHIILKELI